MPIYNHTRNNPVRGDTPRLYCHPAPDPHARSGAGIRGGTIHGKTDGDAAYAIEKPTSPEDLAKTVYHALGIDPNLRVKDAQDRPTAIIEGGKPMLELFG